MPTGFTYYGDLLGISGLYRLGPDIAYKKLNEFYNCVFSCFERYCQINPDIKVTMFSDSLLVWGPDAKVALEHMYEMYRSLLCNGLMLRGAMVTGILEIDPRLTLENFQKMLPKDDTLARAVGLENTQKGCRLLIESQLAKELMIDVPAWRTHEGYIGDLNNRIPYESILRRICPTPDNTCYELLYFWPLQESLACETNTNSIIKLQLEEIRNMLKRAISEHYTETLDLLRRSERRKRFTDKDISIGESAARDAKV